MSSKLCFMATHGQTGCDVHLERQWHYTRCTEIKIFTPQAVDLTAIHFILYPIKWCRSGLENVFFAFKGKSKCGGVLIVSSHYGIFPALLSGVLSLRFNCGTGAAQIVSESHVVVGQWHTVTVFRDGMSGWLRMDNDTPVSGRSQVTTAGKKWQDTFQAQKILTFYLNSDKGALMSQVHNQACCYRVKGLWVS